jgi:hypothetical protein
LVLDIITHLLKAAVNIAGREYLVEWRSNKFSSIQFFLVVLYFIPIIEDTGHFAPALIRILGFVSQVTGI